MRRMFIAAAAALMVVGCAAPQQPASAPSVGYRPLDAYILPPTAGFAFHVSRPAYVAMFEIVPGVGTQLIYPSPGQGRMDGYVYNGDRFFEPMFRGSELYHTAAFRPGGSIGAPRFLFLLASERPLRLEQFGTRGYALRSAMGFQHFASSNAYRAMERVAELALPSMIDDGSWTSDIYVFWPEVLRDRVASREVVLRCNGYAVTVPYELLFEAQRHLCRTTSESGEVERPQLPDDSTAIERPGRRAPLHPVAEEVRGRIGSSRQLEDPELRHPERRPLNGERITAGSAQPEAAQPRPVDRRGRDVKVERPAPGAAGAETKPDARATPAARPAERPAAQPAPPPAPVSRPAPAPAPVQRTKPEPPPRREGREGCDPCMRL